MKTKLLSSLLFIFTSIVLAQAPSNDECANAIVITDDITAATTISFNNSQATESLKASCDSPSVTYLDLWYEFTMPVTGNLLISGVNFADEFTIYESCGDIPTEIACFAGFNYVYNLPAGTYTLRAYSPAGNAGVDSFIMRAFPIAANNECANAEILTNDILTLTTVNFNNSQATESLKASCDDVNTTYLDLWYEFTMPILGNLRFSGVNFADEFTLYDSCGTIPTEIACFAGFNYVYNLPAGTYTLRAYSPSGNAGNDSFTLQAYPIAANDECANAEVITDDILTETFISFNNSQATESLKASCDDVNLTYLDLWYEFTMPITGNLRFSGVNFADEFTLYDSCGAIPTEITCFTGFNYIYNLPAGTYTLRVYSTSGNAGVDNFRIQAFPPAANDECVNAELITDDITTATTISFNNSQATESLKASCDDVNTTYLDLWYEFNMPVTGNLRFSNANFADEFTLYDSCGDIPTEVACFTGSDFVYNIPAGTYTLRAYSTSGNAGADSFTIQAFPIAANDECANAEVISDDITTATTISFNNALATESLKASCDNASTTYLDLWYEFTMPVSGNLSFSGVNFADEFTLYNNCGDIPNELGCFTSVNTLNGILAGTYTLRVYSTSGNSGTDSFTIQAFDVALNDECADATVITDDISNPVTISFNNDNATQSLQASCDLAGETYPDLWYEFTMPFEGNLNISGVSTTDRFTLYSDCGSIPTELNCFSGDSYINNLLAGTYTLRAYSSVANANADSFVIQAFPSISNTTCATAIAIPVATSGDCTTANTTVDLRGATPATVLASCLSVGQEYYDAWFTFQAPITGNIFLDTESVFEVFAVYDACSGNELSCASNDQSIPVVSGTTYTLQLLKRTPFLNEVTFCLEGVPAVAPGIVNTCETLPSIEISSTEGNTNDWVPIFDASNNIVAQINANGNDLGTIDSSLFIDANDVRTSGSQAYLRREIVITPQNQPTSNVDIRLYVLEDEMLDLIAADANLPNSLLLDFMKVDGSTCTTGYTAGGDFIDASTTGYGNDYYIQASISSFSVFYPTSTNLSGTLSVETFNTILGLSIYPTVSNGIINIKAENNIGNSKLSVFDLNGRLIQTLEVKLDSNPIQINLENASKGLYFLKIENNGNTNTQKIILK